MRLEPKERSFYEIEASKNNWSLRELKRQFDTALYERLALSKDKKGIAKLAQEGQFITSLKDLIKDIRRQTTEVYLWWKTFFCGFSILQQAFAMFCSDGFENLRFEASGFRTNANVCELLW